jgi:hypothetical protein
MKITIDIPQIPSNQTDHWNGVLLSFFNIVEEILLRKRRASYLIHFFQERLEKDERRRFLLILGKITLQLSKKVNKKQFQEIRGSVDSDEIPSVLMLKFNFFQRGVSELAKVPHQGPKAGPTPDKVRSLSNIITEEVFKCVRP